MLAVTQEISDKYVRPVSRVDLLEAALQGLYEAARRPLPPGLRRDLELAANQAQLHQVVTRARQQAGAAALPEHGLPASVQALPRAPDPYSCLTPMTDFRRGSGGKYGSGCALDADDIPPPPVQAVPGGFAVPQAPAPPPALAGPLRVAAVHVGGPAQRAGLR